MNRLPIEPRRGAIARFTQLAVRRPGAVVAICAALTGVSVWAASHLEVRSSFEELLPSDVPSVRQVKELVQRVGGDGTVLVVIQSLDGPGHLRAAEELAPKLTREFLALGPAQIRSVDDNVAPVRQWYEEHWPLFAPLDELQKARDTVRDEIRRRTAAANPLAVELDDEAAKPAGAAGQPAWMDPAKPLPREQVAQRFERYVDGFMVHPDGTSLTLIVRPAGTSLGVTEARALVDRIRKIADSHAAELAQNHLRIGLAGTFPMFIAEYEAILADVRDTAVLVVVLVLASIFLFFRDLRSVATLGLAMISAVAVTFGLTWVVIGYLNTQTAFLGAIVLGNGINYGLIYLARLRQLRWRGVGLEDACVEAARTTAHATLLASAATSVSFATLIIAANRGFRHFGFIGGIGMLLCWLFTFSLVPALLALYERVRGAPRLRAASEGERLEPPLRAFFAHPKRIAATFAVLTVVAAALFLHQLPTAMERNLDNLTNEMKGHRALRDDNERANGALGRSLAGSIALLDSREAADQFCDVIRQRMREKPWDQLVDGCDTLSSVVPRDQPQKLAVLRQIVDELPDARLAKVSDPAQRARLRTVRDQLAAQRAVSVNEAPPSLLDRFREKDGTVGRLAVVTAKPLAHIEIAQNLENFVKGVRGVPVAGRAVDATGENVIFADLLKNIETEGPRTTFLSFLGVCVLVFVLFRNVRTSLEVVGALTIGVILMCGVAAAIDLKINFFNFIVFPITFGIAIDYGANVAARVRERGGDVVRALAEVGPAVALCSWTSIIGYGTLLVALNRALRSFGWYAMIGEVTTIVTALVLLPALLLLARARGPANVVDLRR